MSYDLPSMEQLGLPAACQAVIRRPRGLFLVTGPPRSGRSLSIAVMLNDLRQRAHWGSNVILVGELRDLPTIVTALRAAESKLVVATLHSATAQATVNRLIDVFPADQQQHIRTQLATSIVGVLAQRLIPRVRGGRCAAFELLVGTPAIQNLIRENKTFRITSAIETGSKLGMIILDDSLFGLWREGKCSKDDVLALSQLPERLSTRIFFAERGGLGDGLN